MVPFLRDAVLAMFGFMLLEGLWLGWLMTSFYRDRVGPIARMSNGALALNRPAALVVYVLLGAGIAAFAVARAERAAAAAAAGALLGLVVYGVYDFHQLFDAQRLAAHGGAGRHGVGGRRPPVPSWCG